MNFVEGKTGKFYSVGQKMTNASRLQGENECQYKKKNEQEYV